jgi:hypothetical protein
VVNASAASRQINFLFTDFLLPDWAICPTGHTKLFVRALEWQVALYPDFAIFVKNISNTVCFRAFCSQGRAVIQE